MWARHTHQEYVDDTSDRIVWNGQWDLIDGWDNASDNTLHTTHDPNGSASLKFWGTAISVQAIPLNTTGNFSVTMDGKNLGDFSMLATDGSAQPVTVWSVDSLDDKKEHTIEVKKSTNDTLWQTQVPGYPVSMFDIDAFLIEALDNIPANSSTTATGSSSSTSAVSSTGSLSNTLGSSSTTTPDGVATGQADTTNVGGGRPPFGVIVGAVLGSVAWIALMVGLYVLWRRMTGKDDVRPDTFSSTPQFSGFDMVTAGSGAQSGAGRRNSITSPRMKSDTALVSRPSQDGSGGASPSIAATNSDAGSTYPYPVSYRMPPSPIYEAAEPSVGWSDTISHAGPFARQRSSIDDEPWIPNHPYAARY